jgi:hypothetical protein
MVCGNPEEPPNSCFAGGKKSYRLFPFIRKTMRQSLSFWQTCEKHSVPLRLCVKKEEIGVHWRF